MVVQKRSHVRFPQNEHFRSSSATLTRFAAADPREENNLAKDEEYTGMIQNWKRRILNILDTDYVKPHGMARDDWTDEAVSMIGGDEAFTTGWCNNVSIVVDTTEE